MILIVRDGPLEVPNKKSEIQAQSYFLENLKQAGHLSQNWLCGFYAGFMNLPVMLLGALWGNLYLVQARGFSTLVAGNLTSMIFLGLIIGAPLAGWISDRLGVRKILMLLSAVFIFLVAVIIVYLLPSIIFLVILFFILGLCSGALILSYSVVAESNPHWVESTALGIVAVMVNIIGAFSQILFGWLIHFKWSGTIVNHAPFYSVGNFKMALTLLPIAFFLSILIAMKIRETYGKRISES
jgi:MFS family permease